MRGAVIDDSWRAGPESEIGDIFDWVGDRIDEGVNLIKRGVDGAVDLAEVVIENLPAVRLVQVIDLALKEIGMPRLSDIIRANPYIGGSEILGRAVARIVRGQRFDRAFVEAWADSLRYVREMSPYWQTVLGMVPGLGTGVNAAMSAGLALASGQPIDDALIEAAASAVPGGALAQQAAKAGATAMVGLARGKAITEAGLAGLRAGLPNDQAKAAFDVGVALGTGKSVQEVTVSALGAIPLKGERWPIPAETVDIGRKLLNTQVAIDPEARSAWGAVDFLDEDLIQQGVDLAAGGNDAQARSLGRFGGLFGSAAPPKKLSALAAHAGVLPPERYREGAAALREAGRYEEADELERRAPPLPRTKVSAMQAAARAGVLDPSRYRAGADQLRYVGRWKEAQQLDAMAAAYEARMAANAPAPSFVVASAPMSTVKKAAIGGGATAVIFGALVLARFKGVV